MKFLSFIFFFCSHFLLAQEQVNIKEIEKSLAKIQDNFYASKFEVSNKLYRQFLSSIPKDDAKIPIDKVQIDSLNWRDKLASNESFALYYHQHKAFGNYPVVNISYEAALIFCDWLSNYYNNSSNKKFKKVLFRLPSIQEWEKMARGENSKNKFPWEGNELVNKKGDYLCNLNTKDDAQLSALKDNATIMAPVKSYNPNQFGLYNLIGNVSEMTSEKNIVKGGSWIDKPDNLGIDLNYEYDLSPKNNIGFRFVMEVLEK